MEQPLNGLKNWFGESVLIRLTLIGILTLLLLIPSSSIQTLISERQGRQEEVINEISDKWAGEQQVEGPVLILPYAKLVQQKDNAGKLVYKEALTNIYILPENLDIRSQVKHEILHRGIFDAVVYNSKIAIKGKFSALELKKSGINPDLIQWDKAKIDIGLSDLKGLKNNPVIRLDKTDYNVEPDFTSLKLFKNNLIILPDLSVNRRSDLQFSFDLDIRGSNKLSYLHLGKNTTVQVTGDWSNPSFTGRYLPEDRHVDAKGFRAKWQLPYFNRQFPQQWMEDNTDLDTLSKGSSESDKTFGVEFILPVDQYQKTTRTAKYAILIILLTFVSLFFTEMIKGRKIHLFQYILIGAAMIIYYTLLLSFSEQVGFNMAYFIASVATTVLISVFIFALLKNKKAALMFSAILSVFYGFIFVIIQLQDLALLFGSIGLFSIVAAMMYFSARIEWNKRPVENAG